MARRPLTKERVAKGIGRRARRVTQQRLRFGGDFQLDDRGSGSDRLMIVVAGFKDYLWPYSLARVAHFLPDGIDVCVVSAGVRRPELAALAEANGWSYLSTANRRVSAAQNIAIREFAAARRILKIDEDILVGEGCLQEMLDGLDRIEAEGEFEPGFVAPVLNLNGFSYTMFLDTLGLTAEYRERFGGTPHATMNVPVHGDGDAAAWIWSHSVPFDAVAARFSSLPFSYVTVPLRFSIGLILFRRELWESIGGLDAPLEAPGLGVDESHICQECVDRSKVMVVLGNAFAGHFAFGPQEARMRAELPGLADGLQIQTPAAADASSIPSFGSDPDG